MHCTRLVIASVSSPFRRPLRAVSALIVAGTVAGLSFSAAAATTQKKASAASKACYSHTELAAEQMLRMHTELMITGLTCRQVMPDKAPFDKYQEFTVKNRDALSTAEKQMTALFRRQSKNFDTYRTELANEVSRRASIIGTANYCRSFVPRSASAVSLSSVDLTTLTADEKNAGLMHLSQQPLCDVKVVSGPDSTMVASAAPAKSSKKGGKTAKPAASKATPAKAAKKAA